MRQKSADTQMSCCIYKQTSQFSFERICFDEPCYMGVLKHHHLYPTVANPYVSRASFELIAAAAIDGLFESLFNLFPVNL